MGSVPGVFLLYQNLGLLGDRETGLLARETAILEIRFLPGV